GRGEWLSLSQARERIGKGLRPRPAAGSVLPALEYGYRILAQLARSTEDENSRFLPRVACVFSDRTRACWDVSKPAEAQAAADQVPAMLEGLQQAQGSISPLVGLLKDLRSKLPPPAGKDYPDQDLIDSLDQLAPLLSGLTKTDVPLSEQINGLTERI